MTSEIDLLARWLVDSRSAVGFTGAGVSTESGIPDFRSPGGVWARTQPVYFDDFLQSPAARLEYWKQKAESHGGFAAARPNVVHRALSSWEAAGIMRGVITQNIDGLHQLAGSRQVLELHGTAREIACLDCAARFDADPMVAAFLKTGSIPDCPHCGGLLKHATISFGQALPSAVLEEAVCWSQQADLFVVLGSSLVVTPAAEMPALAKRAGARLVILNREATPLDCLADMVIHAALGETIRRVVSRLEAHLPGALE